MLEDSCYSHYLLQCLCRYGGIVQNFRIGGLVDIAYKRDDKDVYFKKITTRVSQNLIQTKMQTSQRHK
jgi:hypothetical protein